jgi:hypothetical protein
MSKLTHTSVVFVHDLRGGSVTDWQDDNGVFWPAEHLGQDLQNARILAFGYDGSKVNVKSDGRYDGGLIFSAGQALYHEVNTSRRVDKVNNSTKRLASF